MILESGIFVLTNLRDRRLFQAIKEYKMPMVNTLPSWMLMTFLCPLNTDQIECFTEHNDKIVSLNMKK